MKSVKTVQSNGTAKTGAPDVQAPIVKPAPHKKGDSVKPSLSVH